MGHLPIAGVPLGVWCLGHSQPITLLRHTGGLDSQHLSPSEVSQNPSKNAPLLILVDVARQDKKDINKCCSIVAIVAISWEGIAVFCATLTWPLFDSLEPIPRHHQHRFDPLNIGQSLLGGQLSNFTFGPFGGRGQWWLSSTKKMPKI